MYLLFEYGKNVWELITQQKTELHSNIDGNAKLQITQNTVSQKQKFPFR